MKRVSFDLPNISSARNEGLALAAGEIVLFIDDDALASPRWVERLVGAFADPLVLAATGFTRGPDGLGWQVRAERMTASGRGRPIRVDAPVLLGPENGEPISTIGTNCAFRREALLAIGGFDPVFDYHLDESDVNLRLARRFPQALTAVIPAAEVIHGLAAGVSRTAGRVPSDLRAIGRSTAVFSARHGGGVDWLPAAQRARLLRHMVAGRLDPLAVSRIMGTLMRGIASAQGVHAPEPEWRRPAPPGFLALPPAPAPPLFLAGWIWQRRVLRARAAAALTQGRQATLLLLMPGIQRHRRQLHAGGWWEQSGGVWGPSQPDDPAMCLMRPAERIARERALFAALWQ